MNLLTPDGRFDRERPSHLSRVNPMAKLPASITRAEIERALKAGMAAGVTRVEIEAGGIKLIYILGEKDGKRTATQVGKRWSLI
jgi:hypothetical protein